MVNGTLGRAIGSASRALVSAWPANAANSFQLVPPRCAREALLALALVHLAIPLPLLDNDQNWLFA